MRGRRIAVVDDDMSIRRVLVRTVTSIPHEVEAFGSAEELLSARPERFDCIILDVHMGHMSGVDLLEELAKAGARLRAVLVSARPNAELVRRAQECGAICFLQKPFRLRELEACITQVCDG